MGVPVRRIVCVCVGRCDIGLCLCTRYRFLFMPACKRLQFSVNVATLSVWDPYHKNQVHSIEMVQWRAARWVLNRYHI